MSGQFGTWHYGTNGPPYNGFGRIARWQCDKVIFCQSLNSSQANLFVFHYEPLIVILIIQVPERLPSGDIEAIFSLCDSDYTFSMWQVPLCSQLSSLQSILTLHINIITLFTLANKMYQAVIHFHTFSINSASPTESS